jgi:MoxR-like ATPase
MVSEPEARRLTPAQVGEVAGEVLDAVGTVVVGKRPALELVLAGILAGGHVRSRICPAWAKR